ncbi:hypothetical protein [Dactylosporangium sp. CA-233914]|uniref:hypothetical protein n=1 Tax=Dactylosporangium sp. CA-233914 TaxID=3239934 RepID=UPI003D9169E1
MADQDPKLETATPPAAGVTVGELTTIEQLAEAGALLDRVWRPGPGNPPITLKLPNGLSHFGGHVAGMFAGGRLAADGQPRRVDAAAAGRWLPRPARFSVG